MVKVLVTGSYGLLGSTLVPFLKLNGYEVITHAHQNTADYQFDLSDPEVTSSLLNQISPNIIINLVGLTNVEFCESNPDQAYCSNVQTVESLSRWIRESKPVCHLIHVSTDHVYDRKKISLQNYYAFSKYTSEQVALAARATVLRLNFFGLSRSPHRESFSDWIYRALIENRKIEVFEDVYFSPLSMLTLSGFIKIALEKKTPGVFNLGSRLGLSKANFAFRLASELQLPTGNITRTSIEQSGTVKTRRPKDMRMDCSNFEQEFGVVLPSLEEEIRLAAKEYCEHRNS